MDSKTNSVNIKVNVGEDPGDLPASNANITIEFGSQRSHNQEIFLNDLIFNQGSTANSLVIVFKAENGNADVVSAFLKDKLFSGYSLQNWEEITKGKINYQFYSNNEKVMIVFTLATDVLEPIKTQIDFILSHGLDLDAGNNKIKLNIASKNDWIKIDDKMKEKGSFIEALFESFSIDAGIQVENDLFEKIVEVMTNMDLEIPEFFNLIPALKNLNLEWNFRNAGEVPQIEKFGQFGKNGFKSSFDEQSGYILLDMKDLIQPEFQFYLTIEDLGIVHGEIKMPGFAKHLLEN